MYAIFLPVLLENKMVKLRSVYVRWLVDFDPRPSSVSLRLRTVDSSRYVCYSNSLTTRWGTDEESNLHLGLNSSLTSANNPNLNCQKGTRWLKSSRANSMRWRVFLSSPLDSFWFSIDRRLRSVFQEEFSLLFARRKFDYYCRKIPWEFRFWPWLNLVIHNSSSVLNPY